VLAIKSYNDNTDFFTIYVSSITRSSVYLQYMYLQSCELVCICHLFKPFNLIREFNSIISLITSCHSASPYAPIHISLFLHICSMLSQKTFSPVYFMSSLRIELGEGCNDYLIIFSLVEISITYLDIKIMQIHLNLFKFKLKLKLNKVKQFLLHFLRCDINIYNSLSHCPVINTCPSAS